MFTGGNMTAKEFRRIALGLTDAIEGSHMGHPDFRVNGRIFATLHPDNKFGMVKPNPRPAMTKPINTSDNSDERPTTA